MSSYYDNRFLQHLDDNITTIFEVGARYGDESLQLSKIFNNARIYSFECNPRTVNLCKQNLENKKNIAFIPYGLGVKNENLPFYSYMLDNDGASSLFKRIDFTETQKETGIVEIKRLSDFVSENEIKNIDLLCMDVQGYELNILKGAGDFINKIRFVIMEEPKHIINETYLPKNVYSKYINAPSAKEISDFMIQHNFIEVARIEENYIEDNVMYKNMSL